MFQQKKLKWVRIIGKAGFTSKGVVYCLVGILVFMAAFEIAGTSNNDAGKLGVFKLINQQTGGKLLLGIVATGLICFAIWRAIQTFADTNHQGTTPKGIRNRLRYLFSGIIYLSISFIAIRIIFDDDSGGSSYRQVLFKLMSKPYGEWVLGLVAFSIAASGIYQIYYGLSEKFRKHINLNNPEPVTSGTVVKAGKIGYLARGIIWLIIAWLFTKAAIHSNASEAGRSIEAFQFIEGSGRYGSILLGITGVGLLCYGVFNLLRARFGSF